MSEVYRQEFIKSIESVSDAALTFCSLVKISYVTKFFHFESGQGKVLDGDVTEVEPFLKDNVSLLQELPNNALLHAVINSRSYKLTTSTYYWEKDPGYSWVRVKETWNNRLWACITVAQ